MTGSVRFQPSGAVVEGSVRGFESPQGVPSNAGAKSVPWVVSVPVGTTSMEVWFRNWSGAGMNCEAWDSNHGHNHHFELGHSETSYTDVASKIAADLNACSRLHGKPAIALVERKSKGTQHFFGWVVAGRFWNSYFG